jgi:CNT family concentrative nucleoside transporter
LGGSLAVLAAARLLSTNRRAISWRTVGAALVTLVVFAFAVLRWSFGRRVLEVLTDGVNAVINATNAGIQFLFGPLIPEPDQGIVFALQVLPVIIFSASLMAVLSYLKVMQVVIKVLGGGCAGCSGPARPSRPRPRPTSSSARPRGSWSSAPTSTA